MKRRDAIISTLGALIFGPTLTGVSASSLANASRSVPKSPPVWAGFGLNGSAGSSRFELTRRYVEKYQGGMKLSDPSAFRFLRGQLHELLKKEALNLVQLDKNKDALQLGEDFLLGFVHDYEIAVPIKNTNKIEIADDILFTFLAGAGLVVVYQRSVGWRVVCSFPFVTRVELPIPDVNNFKESSIDQLGKCYSEYAQSFVRSLKRFGGWKDGYSSNYFARVVKSTVVKKAQPKLTEFKIDHLLTPELLGHETTALICSGLEIPIIPFLETDALSKRYATKFSDSISTQDVYELPEIDLQFEIALTDIEKKVVPSRQRGYTSITRSVTLSFRVFEAAETSLDRKKIFQTFIFYELPEDRIKDREDDTPNRDFLFFERCIFQALDRMFVGMRTKDSLVLGSLLSNLNEIEPQINTLLMLCKAAR